MIPNISRLHACCEVHPQHGVAKTNQRGESQSERKWEDCFFHKPMAIYFCLFPDDAYPEHSDSIACAKTESGEGEPRTSCFSLVTCDIKANEYKQIGRAHV